MSKLIIRDLTVEIVTPSGPIFPVEQFSLSVEPGEIVGLVGESGSGKTMAMRAVVGILPRSAHIASGEILLSDADNAFVPSSQQSHLRHNIAMIFQNPTSYLDPLMSVGKQVAEPLRFHQGLTRKEARTEAIELFRKVGIHDAERQFDVYPHHFSGGMKQRVLIAAALACNPKVLIADEPTTALDVTIQKQILELLCRLRDETGISIIFITHDLGAVSQICDTVSVLYAARIVESASTIELLNAPLHPYSLGLIRSQPESAQRDRPLPSIPGQPPALNAMPSGCRFLPRCEFAIQACKQPSPPPLVQTSAVRSNACLRWRELQTLGLNYD